MVGMGSGNGSSVISSVISAIKDPMRRMAPSSVLILAELCAGNVVPRTATRYCCRAGGEDGLAGAVIE
jgi:hypothetical protein